jgi:enamine deaminase RidA (YjgF/YER057c/UK114 family)
MTRTDAAIRLAQRLQAAGLQMTSDTRPSAFLAQVMGDQAWEDFWTKRVRGTRQSIQAYVWQGEILPTGRSAPAEAVPGASYVIVVPNGAVIFQYGDSPYAPETPGLAPGSLTQDNVEQAMEAHVQALAEELALEELAQAYVAWVAGQVL